MPASDGPDGDDPEAARTPNSCGPPSIGPAAHFDLLLLGGRGRPRGVSVPVQRRRTDAGGVLVGRPKPPPPDHPHPADHQHRGAGRLIASGAKAGAVELALAGGGWFAGAGRGSAGWTARCGCWIGPRPATQAAHSGTALTAFSPQTAEPVKASPRWYGLRRWWSSDDGGRSRARTPRCRLTTLTHQHGVTVEFFSATDRSSEDVTPPPNMLDGPPRPLCAAPGWSTARWSPPAQDQQVRKPGGHLAVSPYGRVCAGRRYRIATRTPFRTPQGAPKTNPGRSSPAGRLLAPHECPTGGPPERPPHRRPISRPHQVFLPWMPGMSGW